MCYCITDDWLMWPAVVVIIIISHLITLLMLVPCLSKHELHIQHLSKNKWDVKQDKRGIIHSKIGFKAHLKRTCPFSCVPVAAGLLKPRREAAADVTASPARTHARTSAWNAMRSLAQRNIGHLSRFGAGRSAHDQPPISPRKFGPSLNAAARRFPIQDKRRGNDVCVGGRRVLLLTPAFG